MSIPNGSVSQALPEQHKKLFSCNSIVICKDRKLQNYFLFLLYLCGIVGISNFFDEMMNHFEFVLIKIFIGITKLFKLYLFHYSVGTVAEGRAPNQFYK